MGGTYSDLPPASPEFPYFTCTFRQPDKLKLTPVDHSVINAVLLAANRHWGPGLQNHGMDQGGAYEFKFSGFPFRKGSGQESALQAKRFCCCLLADLYAMGWHLEVTSDLSRLNDLSTWFFKRAAVERSRPEIICLSLSHSDSLQLIMAPRSLWPRFIQVVGDSYASMGGVQGAQEVGTDLEMKLSGCPWNSFNSQEVIHARKLLLALFRAFDVQNYHFYGTVNLKGTSDCLFFIRDESLPTKVYQYSILSLNRNDRIRMIECSNEVICAIRNLIKQYWTLQKEKDLSTAWEFKLQGFPWQSIGHEAVGSRHLITKIFENLLSNGFSVLAALDISRKVNDKSVFVLRSCQPIQAPHLCISLNETDKIRLINTPPELALVVRKCLRDAWPLGVDSECSFANSLQFKLNGNPWHSSYGGNEYLTARCLMCLLHKRLMEDGWYLVCSADVSSKCHTSDNGPSYSLDVHSWFFVHSTDAPPVPSIAEPPRYTVEHMRSPVNREEPPPYNEIFKD